MKFITFTFFALAFVLLCVNVDAFAQAKWVPQDINIQAPALDTLVVVGDCPSESHDSNRTFTDLIGIGNYASGLTFDLDTVAHKLRNVQVGSSYDQGGTGSIVEGLKTTSFQFSSLDFVILSDSILKVNTNGSAFINSLISASFHIEGFTYICSNRGHWLERVDLDSLLDDTSQYMCSITLLLTRPINIISESKKDNPELIAFTIFPDHSIHFSFPSSDHSQTLAIYDVLGREVKRIEIPSGASEYDLAREQFSTGYYFARLGNRSSKFMVF